MADYLDKLLEIYWPHSLFAFLVVLFFIWFFMWPTTLEQRRHRFSLGVLLWVGLLIVWWFVYYLMPVYIDVITELKASEGMGDNWRERALWASFCLKWNKQYYIYKRILFLEGFLLLLLFGILFYRRMQLFGGEKR